MLMQVCLLVRNAYELGSYRIGTLLFGPSSELANKKASGQLIQVDDPGALINMEYITNWPSSNRKELNLNAFTWMLVFE